ncbi:substrate-binding domain-containing protein [Amorphoplanes digitatis]|uniref:Fructose transport system substrate-binding protein n=1 Tax=Actinoplanes digitatis TaxID=1868 RepID=A0A7W7I5D2_9ACTN|nr:substrate-binding domain-containing protein [Actinoplanes digitatis]MBB4766766.1 fructose transport system substrate-binding protein [Actinoplanes digitatis]GID96628.1 sugar ABC transporter [Actinoplanes digitatis]
MRQSMLIKRGRLGPALVAVAVVIATAACGGDDSGGEQIVGLITKTDTNPFFVKMKEGAQQAADDAGLSLQTFAGKQDGDNEAQVQAIESLISAGARGFLITPSDSKAIVPAIDKAKQQGMLVIALDTPTDPADAADATFATDNYQAGKLIGQWAKAKFEADGKQAKIAMLDLNANQVSVDVKRDQGFLDGFGIPVGDPNKIGDESDPRISGHDVTDGAEDGGRTAMENLLQKDPSINLVYTINEPAAAGAYQAIKAAGKDKAVTIVSIDGGCPGVDNVKAGVIGATSMQFPLKMASLGIEALDKFIDNGTKPQATAGKDFVDTGVTLITDQPQTGLDSEDSAWGKQNCWG